MCLFVLFQIQDGTGVWALRGGQHRQSLFLEKWRDRLSRFRDRFCNWRSEDSYVDLAGPRETQTVYYPIFYNLSSLGVPPPYSPNTESNANTSNGANTNLNVSTDLRDEDIMSEPLSAAISEATTEVEDDDFRIYEAISHGLSLSPNEDFPYAC